MVNSNNAATATEPQSTLPTEATPTKVNRFGITVTKREATSNSFKPKGVYTYDEMVKLGFQTYGSIKENKNGKLYMTVAEEGFTGFNVYLTPAASDLYVAGDKPSKKKICFYELITATDRVDPTTGLTTAKAGDSYLRLGLIVDNTWND